MTLNRRRFLSAAGGALACGVWIGPIAQAAQPPRHILSCGTDKDKNHFVARFDPSGPLLWRQPLPGRGHGIAVRRSGSVAAVFARRPGTYVGIIDSDTGQRVMDITSPQGRHYYGHGVYSADGRYLLAGENDYESGDGVVAVYDAVDGYKRAGEFPSHGTGPHQIAWLPDGKTLAIANGGIRTHPDHGRTKLNLDSMRPNLAFVDVASGQAVDVMELEPGWHQLSIRHIAVNVSGDVAFAMQFQGGKSAKVPLVGVHRPGGPTRLLRAPGPIERKLRHYIGSVAFDTSGRVVAATAPRGGLAVFWNAADGRFLGHLKARDVCGLAPAAEPGAFVLTTGDGTVLRHNPVRGGSRPATTPVGGMHWDNHAAILF